LQLSLTRYESRQASSVRRVLQSLQGSVQTLGYFQRAIISQSAVFIEGKSEPQNQRRDMKFKIEASYNIKSIRL
jgi:hypothetical protein